MSEPEDTQDVLRRLEARLEQASGAAERLLAEAAGSEAEQLAQVLRSLRDRVPEELQRRLAEALRELLLALRALIDWCLEHAEKRRRQSPEPEDIPIR